MYTCSLSSACAVSHHKPSVMCYPQFLDESPTFLSHHRPARLNCLGLMGFISEISCMSLSLHTSCILLYSLGLPFFFFFFMLTFLSGSYLTLSHFASLSLLCRCTNISLFLLNLSLCFPPHPQAWDTPRIAPVLPLARLRKGSNSATFPLVKLGGAIKQPRGLVGSQMVAAELSFR